MPDTLSTHTLLLIEDDLGMAELVYAKLAKNGRQVVHAPSGNAALRWLEDHRPRLVLLDYFLPDLPGIKLVERLASTPDGMPPFIVITGAGDERIAVEFMKRGARDYLVKDSNFLDNLPLAVERALREIDTEERLVEAERGLSEREEKYRSLFENMTNGFALHEMIYAEAGQPVDYRFLEINPAFERLTGLSAAALYGKTVKEVLPGTEQYWIDFYGKVATTGEPASYQNYSEELDRYYDVWAFSPRRGQFAVVFSDITERKQAEDALQSALYEKEVLLRELYHRTKNNMQVISAMLSLEEVRSEDENLKQSLRDMNGRIRSMALVHQKLYQTKSLSTLDLKDYLVELANLMLGSYQIVSGHITLSVQAESVPVVIDTAISCGLVVNEILSNILKYAFPGERQGEIQLRLSREPGDWVCLEIADDGVGLPPEVEQRRQNSLGMQMIFDIARHQLGAQVELESGQGVTWRIRFPEHRYQSRI
ncbi:MAG: histidine kinase dimerization/phosphoacceptor domain -containing protein [Chloroflexota bacterium]